ncbi:urea ABC transporter ATP-binding protein UrtD [Halalkalibacterium halodurans]|uniref:urea ABC transporter ATP-binding protein UrtD n=1 Tax=Halalkalibacterium halodurans TaxID=86665 RepID=UPI001068139E|nr:urea ABC transporter ATP-binding protein UrtD [Halalkalibacterium halodurans]MED3647113.1 urea ABC transporter ATP-binding protein UrtD [Halalkalibacterium halodurans]TES46084.1 urea ABC transporter ATP-binding protein UrtD [Halalkalibacterium halodurans]
MNQTALNEPSEKKPIVLKSVNLSVQFGGFFAIRDFSFTIPEGELHFLVGPNGAGKTTFLDAICGKAPVSKGSLLFHGDLELSKLKEFERVRHGIGRKFQAPSIFPKLTVFENLELSMKQDKRLFPILFSKMKAEERDRMDDMLAFIGLSDERHRIAQTLSHGQKQWLEIGMVMMQEPKLLLLDEPIAGMTETEEEKTGELLLSLKSRCSIIVVEHDMGFVRSYADRVTVMHEGQLLCNGTIDEVHHNEQVIEVYLGRKEGSPHATAL